MSMLDNAHKYSAPREDVEAVTHATKEYFQAWYTGDTARMRQCLHPDLAKRTVKYDQTTRTWMLRHVDGLRMAELAGQGGGSDLPAEQHWQDVTVLDVFSNIASTKFVSHEYVEYVHLARFGQEWLIVNSLWEPRTSP